ncbi:hypothetical protein TNCV_2212741 [Trichonephila clavipes]|nr:hypothetical protein TNCV_2212741 [Trichonephila clavipes]
MNGAPHFRELVTYQRSTTMKFSTHMYIDLIGYRSRFYLFIYLDNNACLRRSSAVEELLESENIFRMDWSACCLEINLIKHMRNAPRRHLAARSLSLENTRKLKQMLFDECGHSYLKNGMIIWY